MENKINRDETVETHGVRLFQVFSMAFECPCQSIRLIRGPSSPIGDFQGSPTIGEGKVCVQRDISFF